MMYPDIIFIEIAEILIFSIFRLDLFGLIRKVSRIPFLKYLTNPSCKENTFFTIFQSLDPESKSDDLMLVTLVELNSYRTHLKSSNPPIDFNLQPRPGQRNHTHNLSWVHLAHVQQQRAFCDAQTSACSPNKAMMLRQSQREALDD